MKVISATKARKKLSEILNTVRFGNEPIAIGRHDKIEAVIIKYPNRSEQEDDISLINAQSPSFDFLGDEPDIYSVKDLKKKYV